MSRSILCTIDFSDASRQALLLAIDMAQEMNMHLTVLHTYRLIQAADGNVVQMKKRLEEDALQKFAQLEKDILQGRVSSYDFKTEVGFMADRIEKHLRNHAISFVVMDRNLSMANNETFEELFERVHVPLVIVPES